MDIIQVGILTTCSFIPKIWKSYKLMKFNRSVKDKSAKKTSNISLPFMFIMFTGMFIWIYHGLLINKSNPKMRSGDAIVFWNVISAFFVFLIITLTMMS